MNWNSIVRCTAIAAGACLPHLRDDLSSHPAHHQVRPGADGTGPRFDMEHGGALLRREHRELLRVSLSRAIERRGRCLYFLLCGPFPP